jgi:hypothetical protein
MSTAPTKRMALTPPELRYSEAFIAALEATDDHTHETMVRREM